MEQEEIKNLILGKIKKAKPASHPLPDVPFFPYSKNAEEDFVTHLIGFDGRAIKFKTRENSIKWLLEQPELNNEKNRIFSSAAGIQGNVEETAFEDNNEIAEINTCVTEGLLGVGEMGAIWVTNESLGNTACALLARKLFILLDYANIVGSMHEAYSKIKLGKTQYGSFFTGPSATADIEAVHITGAQGPLSLTALIYNSPDADDQPQLLVNPNADTSIWAEKE